MYDLEGQASLPVRPCHSVENLSRTLIRERNPDDLIRLIPHLAR